MTEVRIGDVEREQAASALSEHYAVGRLSKDEFERRVEQVWAARFQTDLEPMFADLPSPRPVTRPVPALVRPVPRTRRSPWTPPTLLPLFPLLLVVLIAAAVVTRMPWLLFGLFWLCAFAGGRRQRMRQTQAYQSRVSGHED